MSVCAYKLKQGRPVRFFVPGRGFVRTGGKYEVCITELQHKRLFGDCLDRCAPPVAIGCGAYACAYPHRDPTKVVKITSDEADVASLLKGQQVEAHVVKTFGVHKLTSPARWRSRDVRGVPMIYAIEAERLMPLPKPWRRRVDCAGWVVARWPSWFTPTRESVKRLWACCPKSESKVKQAACRKIARDIARAKLNLAKVGVNWDDIHAGNIGVNAQGRWKAIDLGHNKARLIEDVPSLAGARRR